MRKIIHKIGTRILWTAFILIFAYAVVSLIYDAATGGSLGLSDFPCGIACKESRGGLW